MIADLADTGLASWWAPALAFVAGVVSCASPCVWPLLPGYVSFISGDSVVAADRAAERVAGEAAGMALGDAKRAPGVAGRPRPIVPMLLFILGFTIVFTLFGAFASTFVSAFRSDAGRWVAGSVVIALGLLMIGYAFRRGSLALYAERRPFLAKVRPGTVGALPLGMAFAAGWTPCIGPVLSGILAIAASGSRARGVLLLVSYSLGLGLPFLLVGLGVTRFMGAFGWVKRNYRAIATVSGGLMVFLGVSIITGAYTRFFVPLQRFAPGL